MELRKNIFCPFVTNREHNLFSQPIVLVIQGFNYNLTPEIYKNGIYQTPLQYYWDANNMTYYISLSDNLKINNWVIKTSNNVKPIITEGYSQQQLKLSFKNSSYGFYIWNFRL